MDVTTQVLEVPGAKLYYEVRGSGPLLLLVGCPMEALFFAAMADALAAHHTVVTYDPRGISHSTVDEPDAQVPPDTHADDLHAIVTAVGGGPADVFGSSGGAVNGLALAARHPEDVRTLVAHEPPVTCVLPDAAAVDAGVDEIVDTYRTDGAGAAFVRFLAQCGLDVPDGEQPPTPPNAYQERNDRHFFLNLIRTTTRYRPDAAALRDARTRVVVAVGADSGDQLAARTARAVAATLGAPLVEFPGDHGGFLGTPGPFLATLRNTLA